MSRPLPLLTGRDLAASPHWPIDRERPLHLDLGTGLGHFLVDLALRHPEADFVGIEMDAPVARRAARRIASAGVVNAKVVRADGRNFLAESLPPQALAHLWINFPDPWPKDRHADRRHTNPLMIELMLSRLQVGGVLHLATDAMDYAADLAVAMTGQPAVVADCPAAWRRADLGIQTKYERKWRAAGRPVACHDWTLQQAVAGPPLPAVTAPPALVFGDRRPPVGLHQRGNYLARVFPAAAGEEMRLLLIDARWGLETFAKIGRDGVITLHGPWTEWKSDLLRELGAVAP